MQYNETVTLKDGQDILLRSGCGDDAAAVLENFQVTHAETDYLLTYPEESRFTEAQERAFLERKSSSPNEVEILALMDGRVVGMAGIDSIGAQYKVRHRAEYGVSILRAYWGLGIGRALTQACIRCARQVGYTQLELTVVAENARAMALYRSLGFIEYGRNPRGFLSRESGYQETVHMRLEL